MAKYFNPSEFVRCTPSCRIGDMDLDFLDLMDRVREAAGIPLVLNSAYRTVAWEKKQGRTGTSSHCKGIAVDIRCNTSANRFRIVKAAIECGVPRIGIGKTFIHLDTDRDKPCDIIFDYYD